MNETAFKPLKRKRVCKSGEKCLTPGGPCLPISKFPISGNSPRTICRQCYNAQQREKYKSGPGQTRVCVACGDEKLLRYFAVCTDDGGRSMTCRACAKRGPYTPPPVEYPRDTFGRVKLIKHWTRAEFADVMRQLDD